MTIERLHFEGGIQFDEKVNARKQLTRIVLENRQRFKFLPEGEYDLTPSGWEDRGCRYNLVVFEDGRGLLRLIPQTEGMVTVEQDTEGSKSRQGGYQIMIPENRRVTVVIGPLKGSEELRIFEVIAYFAPANTPPLCGRG